MTDKSPLEQAQDRILALEADCDALAREAKRAIADRDVIAKECKGAVSRAEASEEALRDLRATTNNHLAAILLDNGRLRTALLTAVKMYGQTGGPWNVSSEPGEWLAMAKEALGVASRNPETAAMLDLLNCPSRHWPAGSVPEAEIRCRFLDCIHGQGVAGNGICPEGNPRDAQCPAFRETCGECLGDGAWNGERATCETCGGMGWIRPAGEAGEG